MIPESDIQDTRHSYLYSDGIKNDYRTDKFRNGRVNKLQECANMFQYDIDGYGLGDDRPAASVTALLIDVQSWGRAELAAGEMVEQLRQDAINERESGSAKPKTVNAL